MSNSCPLDKSFFFFFFLGGSQRGNGEKGQGGSFPLDKSLFICV
jgi:hypothetical protein